VSIGAMIVEHEKPLIPFLKWAGGKRWLVDHVRDIMPTAYDRYVEPFLGGGALFFSLCPPRALLADINFQLIETYRAIQEDWIEVQRKLEVHQISHSREYYYEERSKKRRTAYGRAAQLIYLNRTCWNGLYRVNLAGRFNVPIGTKTSVLMDADNFEEVAKRLKRAVLLCEDFEQILQQCGAGDFVFVDPPYTVKHNVNGFVKYNETLFSWDDQVRLQGAIVSAKARGAKVLMTNADHSSVRQLYRGVGTLRSLERASVLAGDAQYRARVSELVLTTWEPS
jgi:DNA adenine methylase